MQKGDFYMILIRYYNLSSSGVSLLIATVDSNYPPFFDPIWEPKKFWRYVITLRRLLLPQVTVKPVVKHKNMSIQSRSPEIFFVSYEKM